MTNYNDQMSLSLLVSLINIYFLQFILISVLPKKKKKIMKVKSSRRDNNTLVTQNIVFLPRFAPSGDCFDLQKHNLEQATLKALNMLKLNEAVILDIADQIESWYVCLQRSVNNIFLSSISYKRVCSICI